MEHGVPRLGALTWYFDGEIVGLTGFFRTIQRPRSYQVESSFSYKRPGQKTYDCFSVIELAGSSSGWISYPKDCV